MSETYIVIEEEQNEFIEWTIEITKSDMTYFTPFGTSYWIYIIQGKENLIKKYPFANGIINKMGDYVRFVYSITNENGFPERKAREVK